MSRSKYKHTKMKAITNLAIAASIRRRSQSEILSIFQKLSVISSRVLSDNYLSTSIRSHDRIVLAICEHIGAEEAVGVGGGEGVGVDEPAVGEVVVPALEVVKARLTVVIVTTVAQGVDVPDEGRIRGLFAVSTMHGIAAPRVIGAAAQRNTADNDDDLWLCADGCTHHSDHLSISQRAVLIHRPQLITTTICPFIILDQSPE